MLFPGGDVAQAQFMRRRFCITCLERGRRMECMKLSRWMLARLPLPIREIERPNSHFNGLGVLRQLDVSGLDERPGEASPNPVWTIKTSGGFADHFVRDG